jgi:hypothetical protein
MKYLSITVVVFILSVLTLPGRMEAQMIFKSAGLRITVSTSGQITSLLDVKNQNECLAKGQPSPFISIKVKGKWEVPNTSQFFPASESPTVGILLLTFENSEVILKVKTREAPSHIVFELAKAQPADLVEAIVWGPYPTVLQETIGEIIGVVRDETFAFGLQILNVKTLGGYPLNEEGSDPSRSNTAKKTEWGSLLQAFSLDRSKPRKINVWWDQFPNMPVPAIPGETVEGSSIALFGCAPDKVLKTIGEVEVAEKLPHPLIDGIWGKISPQSGRSYLIADYSEATIDELLVYTERANLMTLYHMNAWQSWGHYQLDSNSFPHGLKGFKDCLKKAHDRGIRLGAHTLTDFIHTNDPYVTPVPDPRLAITGSSLLTKDIDERMDEIPVLSLEYFDNDKANWLRTVRIDNELIQYDSVSKVRPYRLIGCKRGAFGTHPSSHAKGDEVGKLLDHPYKVFFPNFDLLKEIAKNLAFRFNETGLEQMDFDGHEGCLSTGQGDYALELFAKIFYDNLDHTVINGTSTSEPFYWHINTYCNWGEPWNGGFTESMQQYRLDNQGLLERNYLPNMLGWYLLTEKTTVPEMEWMLARSAGYNAGFAMATSLEALRKNPNTGALLDAIREWEICRRDHAFPEELKAQLKDPGKEFHLEKLSNVTWNLYPMQRITADSAKPVTYTRGDAIKIMVPVK